MGIVGAFLLVGMALVILLVVRNFLNFYHGVRQFDRIATVEEALEILRLEKELEQHPQVVNERQNKEVQEAELDFFAQLKAHNNFTSGGGLAT